jgi:hypothetical protein
LRFEFIDLVLMRFALARTFLALFGGESFVELATGGWLFDGSRFLSNF